MKSVQMEFAQLGNLIFVSFAYYIIGATDDLAIQKCFLLVACFDSSVVLIALVGVCMNWFDKDPAAGKEARK